MILEATSLVDSILVPEDALQVLNKKLGIGWHVLDRESAVAMTRITRHRLQWRIKSRRVAMVDGHKAPGDVVILGPFRGREWVSCRARHRLYSSDIHNADEEGNPASRDTGLPNGPPSGGDSTPARASIAAASFRALMTRNAALSNSSDCSRVSSCGDDDFDMRSLLNIVETERHDSGTVARSEVLRRAC